MDNIRIEIAQPSQHEAITEFLVEYFRVDEPITRSVNLNKEDARVFFRGLAAEGLKRPVSFVVLNDKDEIIGCRLNEVVDINSSDHHEDKTCGSCDQPDAVRKILGFLDVVTKDTEKLLPPDTKRVMKFIVVSVHPHYQRRGIAKELIEKSLRMAIDNLCDYVCTGATAFRSQELFEKKLGFQTLRVVPHTDYRDPDTDQQIINCDDGTNCGKLMVKKLR